MTFPALGIHNEMVRKRINWPHRILVQLVATAELATVASAPTEKHPLFTNSCCMVISEGQFDNLVALKLDNLTRYGLLQDIYVTKTSKASITPCVNHAVCGDSSGVTITCFDP